MHSISFEVPDQLIPTFPAYEERFLCLLIRLLRGPRSRVIYVTSQPILPRIVDYFFGLVPELDTPEARSRFHVVSLVDGTNRPLSAKLLERPGAIERIKRLIADPEIAILLPFSTSPLEVELAVRLGIPLYGADPVARVPRHEAGRPAAVRGRGRAAAARASTSTAATTWSARSRRSGPGGRTSATSSSS